jgi:hypothetical protein
MSPQNLVALLAAAGAMKAASAEGEAPEPEPGATEPGSTAH